MRSAIDGFVEGLGEIYEGELESVWMGGSRAREFGNPEASDVDLLLLRVCTVTRLRIPPAATALENTFCTDRSVRCRPSWAPESDFLSKEE